jgi:hypothetical protein
MAAIGNANGMPYSGHSGNGNGGNGPIVMDGNNVLSLASGPLPSSAFAGSAPSSMIAPPPSHLQLQVQAAARETLPQYR